MSHDLFAVAERQVQTPSRRPSLVLASILVHGALMIAIIVVSIVAPAVLPHPHAAALAWSAGPKMVRLTDIPLPARKTITSQSTTSSPVAIVATPTPAPVAAPSEITPERPGTSGGLTAGSGGTPLMSPAAGVGIIEGATLSLPTPPPAPTAPIRLHSGIDAPRKIRDVAPVFPALARSAGAQGMVIVEATIDVNGDVVAARVLRSAPLLDDAALLAVRQWKFTPARLNGEPVAVLMTITVNFTLGGR